MKKISKKVGFILKFIISLAFFSVLLTFVKSNELLVVFSNINWLFFCISFCVTLIMVLASCAKWKIILDLKSNKQSFWELFKIYLVGYFFSNILPSTIGGDVVRSYYAGKIIENQAYSAVSVFVERFSGIFFLFLLVPLAPLFQRELYGSPSIYIPACAGLLFAGIVLWIWKAENPFKIPNSISLYIFKVLHGIAKKTRLVFLLNTALSLENFYNRIIKKLNTLREELQIAVNAAKTDKVFLFRLVSLTVLFYVLTWVNVYTAFRTFNIEVSFVSVCAIVPAVMLVAHVPVTLLGNLGYFESVFVFYFLLVGVDGAESLAMGLMLRLKMLTMGVVGYIAYLLYKQKHQLNITMDSTEN
jgi:uncharacterized protein (TIRG00374 family)